MKKLLSVSFTPTFLVGRRDTCEMKEYAAKIYGTGRFKFEWDDGTFSYPYSILTDKRGTGEFMLWSSKVCVVEKDEEIRINLEVFSEVLKRGIKRFECWIHHPFWTKNKDKRALGRHTIQLNNLAFDLQRRLVKNLSGDTQIAIKLTEMTKI